MAAPTMTFGAAGNALASMSLGANLTTAFNVDVSAKFEGQVNIKVTMGAAVAATAGVKVEIFEGYGSTPTYTTTNPNYTYTIPAGAASAVVYGPKFFVSTGKWQFKLTNLDATNAVTVEGTLDTVDSVV